VDQRSEIKAGFGGHNMWVILLILKIILYLVAALLLFVVTLLVIPFSYKGEAEVHDGVSFSYKIGWFWNFIHVRGNTQEDQQTASVFVGNKRVFTMKTREDHKEEDSEQDAEKEKEDKKERSGLKRMFDTKLIKEGFQYLKKILKHLSPKYLHLYGTYGFEDPSLTGMTAGFIYSLQGIWKSSRIHLEPCFTDVVLDIDFKAEGRIYAGRLVYDTVRFVLKKEVRTKIFRKNKKVKPKSN
jgi:hypothetical protein